MSDNLTTTTGLSRRDALRRMVLSVTAAYVTPEVIMLSAARAGSSVSVVSVPTAASVASVATPPTPPSPPESVDQAVEVDEREGDSCKGSTSRNNSNPELDRGDSRNAQAAVAAGYAKPLEEIWPDFVANYSGTITDVEFTGFQYRPTYRIKAISPRGHLETVIVSARTGKIIRIVGC